MKKIVSVVIICLLLVSLVACGESTPSKYEGKYVCVAAEIWGVALDSDDMADVSLELNAGGSGKFTSGDETDDIKWSEKDGKLIITADGIENSTTLGDDTVTIDDYCGIGAKYVFAREGSAAADPSLYITLSEEEEAMVGDWKSYAVEDVLGDDLSDEYYADAIELKIEKDHTYTLIVTGEEFENGTWNSLGTWGYGENSEHETSWTLEENGEIKLSSILNEEDGYVYYTCKK